MPYNRRQQSATEAESMVFVTIQQDTSIIPPMTSSVIDLVSRPDSPNVHWPLPTTTTTTAAPTTTTTTTTLPLPPQPQQGSSDSILIKRIGELETTHSKARFSKASPPGRTVHAPPPPPPPSGATGTFGTYYRCLSSDSSPSSSLAPTSVHIHNPQGDQSTVTGPYPSSSKSAASAEYSAWTTTDTQIKPSITQIPDDLLYGRMKPLQMYKQSLVMMRLDVIIFPQQTTWASALRLDICALQRLAYFAQTGDMATFMDWYCKQRGIYELTPKDLEGPAFEIVKVFHHDVQRQQAYSTGRPDLGNSKRKAAYYPDSDGATGADDSVLEYEECKYDIAAMYDISHWWVQRQRFYIDQFSSEGDRRAVRTHMRILSVVRIEVFSMYGYNYMKKIVLRRADLKEYVIPERDFKHMYPSDFEDLYLLNLQGHLNHLSPEDKKILTTDVNLMDQNLVIDTA
ncbi:hypothetical protein Tco_0341517 [Tanacetum coccineum]